MNGVKMKLLIYELNMNHEETTWAVLLENPLFYLVNESDLPHVNHPRMGSLSEHLGQPVASFIVQSPGIYLNPSPLAAKYKLNSDRMPATQTNSECGQGLSSYHADKENPVKKPPDLKCCSNGLCWLTVSLL